MVDEDVLLVLERCMAHFLFLKIRNVHAMHLSSTNNTTAKKIRNVPCTFRALTTQLLKK